MARANAHQGQSADECGLPGRRGRPLLFAILTLVLTFGLGILAVEWGLRRFGGAPPFVDHLDEGMFVYHPRLGWTLAPEWRGRHRNADFDVAYTINRSGHRGATVGAVRSPAEARIAYLGDSFTFAMGVNDDETFTEVLNRADAGKRLHLNFGHPGYSTDQALLFAEERMAYFEPDVIALVVYLGNDLLDNLAPYPLQADFAKPFFTLSGGRLTLNGVPVPREPKPPALKAFTYADAIGAERPALAPLLARSQILSRLASLLPPADHRAALAERHRPAIDLFVALVDRLAAVCREHAAQLVVILLPGKSFVDDPRGISAQYQEVIRAAIVDRLHGRGVPVLDVATPLRVAFEAGRRDLYHPNEGHLTAAGNRFVAELIGPNLPPAAGPGSTPR